MHADACADFKESRVRHSYCCACFMPLLLPLFNSQVAVCNARNGSLCVRKGLR